MIRSMFHVWVFFLYHVILSDKQTCNIVAYRANKEAHIYNLLLHLTAGWEGGQLISLWVIHHFRFNPDLDILSSNNPWPFALTCKGEETIPYTPHSDFSIVNGDSCSHSWGDFWCWQTWHVMHVLARLLPRSPRQLTTQTWFSTLYSQSHLYWSRLLCFRIYIVSDRFSNSWQRRR